MKLLVNNAGVAARADFLTGEPERIERVIRTNYLGSVWCLRAFLPALEAARPADVVNVVSVAGTVAFPPAGPYAASKHAQLAFSRAMSASLRTRGIRVHTVNPGFVETEGFPQRSRLRGPLLRTVIEPEDVARHIAGLVGGPPGRDVDPALVPRAGPRAGARAEPDLASRGSAPPRLPLSQRFSQRYQVVSTT